MIHPMDSPPILITNPECDKPSQNGSKDTDQETANKALVRQLFEDLWNNADADAAVKYLAANYTDYAIGVMHNPEGQCRLTGPAKMIALVGHIRSAFPNIKFYILQLIAERNRVVAHFIGTGRCKGKFNNVVSTGAEVDLVGSAIHRIADGQIIDSYHFLHILGLGVTALPPV